MQCLQNLNGMTNDEAVKFVKSFDYVFCDIDGVLVLNRTVIPGADQCVRKFRQLGKTIGIVTNNTIYPLELLRENLKAFEATANEIITPNLATIAHLKKINFNKDIFVIGSATIKKMLRDAGYNVVDLPQIVQVPIEENLSVVKDISVKVLERAPNIGAVLVDMNINFNIIEAQAAMVLLNFNKDVLFLTGMSDDKGPLSESITFIAPKFYIDVLKRLTNKTPIEMAKPGLALKEVLVSRFGIIDTSRVLFIGDSIYSDIALGIKSGFQTLLVLSGTTTHNDLATGNYPEEFKPKYYIQDLGKLLSIIENVPVIKK